MPNASRFILAVSLLAALALTLPVRSAASPSSVRARGAELRIVGPGGENEDPPVVNERGKIRLRVIDESGATVSVSSFSTGSPSVARVTRKGVLKGKLFGFATITAATALGEVKTTAVVARVTRRHGAQGDGDSKSDSAGRVYLTSPDEQVIYRSDGTRDEIFAGAKGQSGYRDGSGVAARFNYPTGLGVDVSTNGGLYVADTDNHCVRKVGFDGRTKVAVGIPELAGRVDADVVAADQAMFDSPKGVAASGPALFISDTKNHAIYYVDGRGESVSLLAGQPGLSGFRNGLFREAAFYLPSGLALSAFGNLVAVADTGNDAVRLVRLETGGVPYLGRVSTVGTASSGRGVPASGFVFSAPTSVAFDSADNVCVVDSTGASVVTRAADGTEARVLLAQPGSLGRPASIVVSGTRAIISDADASSPGVAIAVVEVGAPRITNVTPSRLPEGRAAGELVIEGANFPPEARVIVDGVLLEDVRVESAVRISVAIPEIGRGARLVSVLTRGGVAQREINVVPPALDEIDVGEITTFAGTETPALGDGGLATEAALAISQVVLESGNAYVGVTTVGQATLDASGNVFVASPASHRVRRIDAQSRVVTTFAGTGEAKAGLEGRLANAFGLVHPTSVAIGTDGTLFVADPGCHRVLRINPITTEVTTVLGDAYDPGAGQPGEIAGPAFRVDLPTAVAVDSHGALYVADAGNLRVLRVDPATQVVTVVAGGGSALGLPEDGAQATSTGYPVLSLDVDSSGQLALESDIANDGFDRQVMLVSSNGTVRRVGDRGESVALDGDGALYFYDRSARTVIRRDPLTGSLTVVAGGGREGTLGDGGAATDAHVIAGSIAVDATGNVFVLDEYFERVRRVDHESGRISTVGGKLESLLAGDGGLATSANLYGTEGLAWVEGRGMCLVDKLVRAVRVVDPKSGMLTTPIGNGPRGASPVEGDPALGSTLTPYTVAAGDHRRVLVTHVATPRSRHEIWSVAPSGTLERVAGFGLDSSDGIRALDTMFGHISAMELMPNDDILVVDSMTKRLRVVESRTGLVRTLAGRIYEGSEYSGEGGPAVSATLISPGAAVVAPNGTIYFTDANCIRRVDPAGTISTVTNGDFGVPAPGALLSEVRFGAIRGLAMDSHGDLFVSDFYNNVVVRLDLEAGKIVFVAGSVGSSSLQGDGELATDASLGAPSAMAFDADGNLYVLTAVGDAPPGLSENNDGIRIVRVIRFHP